MKLKFKIMLLLLFFISQLGLACSVPPGKPSIGDAYKMNDDVYLAFAQSIDTKESKDKNGNTIIEQTVVFRVIETWKGNYKVGQELTFQTTLHDGSCGVGATNESKWLEEEPPKDSLTHEPTYPRLSGIWLIYENNTTQHQLNNSGRTSPLEYGGAEDLQKLYRLRQNKRSY